MRHILDLCGTATVSVFVLFIGLSSPPSSSAQNPAIDLQKVAKDAEVHGVGFYEPLYNRLEDISDWPQLVTAVRSKKGPGGRVWELLSPDTQKLVSDDKNFVNLNDPNPRASRANPIKGPAASDLRKMINNPDFYSKDAFKDVELTKELTDLISRGAKRTAWQTAKLNWMLLARAFPGCVPELPERFRTIQINVAAGREVVLVLSCHDSCRWQVTLDEGAKVVGIVLCGYHSQEISGYDGNVVYRAYYGPDGTTVLHPTEYFYGYNKASESFKDFVAKMKAVTGKEFTTFQGSSTPKQGDEPYKVRPSKK